MDNGLKPACANLCPTGALNYEKIEADNYSDVIGFTDLGHEPGINIIPLRIKNKLPENNQTLTRQEETLYKQFMKKDESKVTLKKEWPLVIFTVLAALLVSIVVASLFDKPLLNPWLFITSGMLGQILSSIHLGKKLTAWRSILNLFRSWLSKEIFFFTLFLFLGTVYFFISEYKVIGVICAVVGFFTLLSMDMVYRVAIKTTPFYWNSASVLLSGLFFISILTGFFELFWLIVFVKFGLYLYRKCYFYVINKNNNL